MTCKIDFNNCNKYFKLSGLENLYLEDSYVLNVMKYSDKIIFIVEFVLTEKHEFYHSPIIGEKYCYKIGSISFKNISKWIKFTRTKDINFDTDGEVDFGNIDIFVYKDKRFFLCGDWGELDIISEPPSVQYL